MSERRTAARAIATVLGLVTMAATAVAIWADLAVRAAGSAPTAERFPIVSALSGLTFALVGVVIIWRQPRNPIAWFLLLAGVTVQSETAIVPLITLTHEVWDTDPRWVEVAAVATDSLWLPAFAAGGTGLFLLFPDGRLPSPRWRPVLWAVVAMALAWIPATLVADDALYAYEGARNPLTVRAIAPVAGVVQGVAGAVVTLGLVVGIAALVVRWRASAGIERQQLKYLLLAPTGFAIAVVAGIAAPDAAGTSILIELAPVTIPLAIGAAIMRRGLWGIDRLISRTVAYAVVLAILAGTYLALVLALGAVTRAATGETGDLVVALSTLAVVALFQPVRGRVSASVDRRFDRSRYDAARTIDAFGRRLRDELDLARLTDDLAEVATRTMRPTSVVIWLPMAQEAT